MQISNRERKILLMGSLVGLLFLGTSLFSAIGAFYDEREANIERVQLDIERERRLIENTASWRERRVQSEAITGELEAQIFTGDTIPIVEANIQRALSQHARNSSITVSSTRLAERLETRDWLLISQEMSFRTLDDSNTIRFLELLESSAPRLWVSDFNLSRSRNQYSGSITVVGFARSLGSVNQQAETNL
ncbi:MAG: hypothetical protein QGF90_11395 [Gammaproteobacteria bacterium]|jgi:hypothetical protein|nr:hypothetical protein [Gammaproteobacteria bacterium]